MNRIAVFDIGNTSLKCAIASGGKLQHLAVADHATLSGQKLGRVIRELASTGEVDGAIACCVAPAHGKAVREWWGAATRLPLVFLNHRMKMPIALKGYPSPATIGADRLASASASYATCKGRHMVIDAGTAATIDCIDTDGRFMGGAIAPGPDVMTSYLSAQTDLLPEIDCKGVIPKVGRSTAGAMKIGVKVGYASLMQGVVDHLKKGAFGKDQKIPVFVTGGHAKRVAGGLTTSCRISKNLTLAGLALIYDLNFQTTRS